MTSMKQLELLRDKITLLEAPLLEQKNTPISDTVMSARMSIGHLPVCTSTGHLHHTLCATETSQSAGVLQDCKPPWDAATILEDAAITSATSILGCGASSNTRDDAITLEDSATVRSREDAILPGECSGLHE